MWRSRNGSGSEPVACVACGTEIDRDDAREYDKHGDRWERSGKSFEYLCKPCFRCECHQPRDELEALLVDLDAGDGQSNETFLAAYVDAVDERYGPIEE
jgi:hypothetical protein